MNKLLFRGTKTPLINIISTQIRQISQKKDFSSTVKPDTRGHGVGQTAASPFEPVVFGDPDAQPQAMSLKDMMALQKGQSNELYITVAQLQELLNAKNKSDNSMTSSKDASVFLDKMSAVLSVFTAEALRDPATRSSESDSEMFARPDLHDVVEKKPVEVAPEMAKKGRRNEATEKERLVMFENLVQHVPAWRDVVKSAEDLTFKKLNGNSNAVYRVEIKTELYPEFQEPRTLLYRRYEQELIEKDIEQAIFNAMSIDGSGPKVYFQNDVFRIEEFFHGRSLTLWEMRNPLIAELCISKICDFNFNALAQSDVEKFQQRDPHNLFIHQVINEWGPNLERKIGKIKSMLKGSDDPEHQANYQKAVLLERTFLFEGYREYFEALVPKPGSSPFPIVLTHNDCHQNNIMMNLNDNRDLILIDCEYAGWNPMAMDLAVYINETMNHNSHPGGNGVEWYLDNMMSAQEQRQLINSYLQRYFNKYLPKQQKELLYCNNYETFKAEHFSQLQTEVWDCCLLNNFFWGVWSLSLLSEEEFLNKGIFNYDFAHSRCDMYNQFKQTDSLKTEANTKISQ